MVPSTATNSKSRDRAKIVCFHCHVRCDLQEQDNGICSNCKRRGQNCRRHNDRGARVTRNRAWSSGSPISRISNSRESTSEPLYAGLDLLSQSHNGHQQTTRVTLNQPGYIGEQSLMSPSSSVPAPVMQRKAGTFPDQVNREILRVTGATSLPTTSRIQVFTDTYFKHLYHLAPVIDRGDLLVEQPSILLLQAICLIGSHLRYPRDESPVALSEPYYLKVKTLIYTKHEHDNFAILKSLCILCFWIITPPVVVSLDGSYHWLGVAVRLAHQMGLHRESSYSKLSNSGAARRIMWFLFNIDKVQAAAFGRPSIVGSQSLGLRPLELGDFESVDTIAEIYIEYTKLNMILEKIVEFQDRKAEISVEQVSYILGSLGQWITNLPNKLRLYHQSGQRDYRRDTYEMHIHYFTYVILFLHLYGQAAYPSMAPTASLVASSCMARLYEEIDDRDEINYLTPAHNWSLMVGCIPQIHRDTMLQEEDDLCNAELDIFVAALKCMRLKWPPANNILTTVERLRQSKGDAKANPPVEGQHNMYPAPSSNEFQTPILKGLFPFPRDMCPRMILVNPDVGEGRAGMGGMAEPAIQGFMDWIFDEFNLDDLNMAFVS